MSSTQELENLTYTEYINITDALKIIQNWNSIINKLPEKRRNKIIEKTKDFDPLIHLKKICKEKKEIIHTTYKFSKSLKTYGRLFAQNSSLQGLPREIRNTIAYDFYYDIDMKNAHPTILNQYCKINGIRSNILEQYVNNRDEIIKKFILNTNISQDEAKHIFLSILNGGLPKIENDFIKDFIDEIKLIHKQVCLLNPEEFKKIKLRKEYNPEGTMMNIILCKLEHLILINAVKFFREKGYNVDVLIFDGFMLRKEKDKELNDNILKELNIYIKEKTNYNIEFVEKSLNNKIDLSEYVEPLYDEDIKVSYYKDKEEFEKTHLKIQHPLMYLTFLEDGSIDYQTEEKIKGSYKTKKTIIIIDKKPIKIPFITTWINDEYIRQYQKMVFEPPPSVTNNCNYNTWRGFEIENINLPNNFNVNTNEYVLKYKEFISNLFDDNQDYVNYYDAWCANIIQYPALRSCICVVLYSADEGVGKNMSSKTLELCISERYTFYITDATNQLFGKHSSAELNKLLVVLNEVKGKDTYTNTDLFKTRITDPKREVELKGKDTFQMINYASYILNTNNLKAVNAGEKDRRFCILPCNNKKINDKIYFDDYEKTINKNPEAIRCIYEYLKTYDIEKIVPNKLFAGARPKSDLYLDLQSCNREREWDFLEYYISNVSNGMSEITETTTDLWIKYKFYCSDNNYDISKISSKHFHFLFTHNIIKHLNKNIKTIDAIIKIRNSSERGYTFNTKKLKKYFELK
jgi:hypothetical protein